MVATLPHTNQPQRAILVTGVPRSGTTWLAQQLTRAPGTAMTGREPMNPHRRQYALGGSIKAWEALATPTARHRRALRRAYRGWTPRVYGRYGSRQWAAPLPNTTIVVKDPFAVLAITTVYEVTGARPVLVYRHPGAVLASYRRMGWSPDIAEVNHALPADQRDPVPADNPAAQLAWFWKTLNDRALLAVAQIPQAIVVAHEELAAAGPDGMRQLFSACGLTWREPALIKSPPAATSDDRSTLHRLDRPSEQVASSWRKHIDPPELKVIDGIAGQTFDRLQSRRLHLKPLA